MSANRPSLSHTDVQNWTQPRFYERGEGYVRQGRIRRPRREGALLKAECQGSQPSPYHVEAKLDADGIVGAECSCPMGGGGYSPETTSSLRSGRCKHAVALLLTWVESPEAFSTQDPLEQTLHSLPKERLVQLVLSMVERHPDLERLVTLSSQAVDAALDPDELRDQIASVFEGIHYSRDPYQAAIEVAEDLEPFFELAKDYREHGRLEDAVTVYRLLIEETQDHYMELHDEEGTVGSRVAEASRHLGVLLDETDDASLRERMLHSLFETYLWNVDLGGYGFGDWAYEALLEQTTYEERRLVAGWVRDHLPDAAAPNAETRTRERRVFVLTSDDTSWGDTWKRETLGGFLLDLEAETLDDEAFLRICRQTGRHMDLVNRLLDLGRLDDALDVAREASDLEMYRLASTFADHNAEAALYDVGLNRLNDATDRRLIEWLYQHAADREDPTRALDLARHLFWDRPSVDAYERLREAAQAVDRWGEVQSQVLDRLREGGNYATLTRLHLSDDNVEAALETVSKTGYASWSYSGTPLRIEVAEAAEDEHPEAAIDLYIDRALSLIADRGRDNYAEAATYMQRVKALYERLGEADTWDDLLDTLYDDELHRLPAAHDEFEKAGLL